MLAKDVVYSLSHNKVIKMEVTRKKEENRRSLFVRLTAKKPKEQCFRSAPAKNPPVMFNALTNCRYVSTYTINGLDYTSFAGLSHLRFHLHHNSNSFFFSLYHINGEQQEIGWGNLFFRKKVIIFSATLISYYYLRRCFVQARISSPYRPLLWLMNITKSKLKKKKYKNVRCENCVLTLIKPFNC